MPLAPEPPILTPEKPKYLDIPTPNLSPAKQDLFRNTKAKLGKTRRIYQFINKNHPDSQSKTKAMDDCSKEEEKAKQALDKIIQDNLENLSLDTPKHLNTQIPTNMKGNQKQLFTTKQQFLSHTYENTQLLITQVRNQYSVENYNQINKNLKQIKQLDSELTTLLNNHKKEQTRRPRPLKAWLSIDNFFRSSGINNDEHLDEKDCKTSDTKDEYLIGSSVFKTYSPGFLNFLVKNAANPQTKTDPSAPTSYTESMTNLR